MEDESRLKVMEDELKLLKGEVKRTLVDLRALVMRQDSPLNEGGQAFNLDAEAMKSQMAVIQAQQEQLNRDRERAERERERTDRERERERSASDEEQARFDRERAEWNRERAEMDRMARANAGMPAPAMPAPMPYPTPAMPFPAYMPPAGQPNQPSAGPERQGESHSMKRETVPDRSMPQRAQESQLGQRMAPGALQHPVDGMAQRSPRNAQAAQATRNGHAQSEIRAPHAMMNGEMSYGNGQSGYPAMEGGEEQWPVDERAEAPAMETAPAIETLLDVNLLTSLIRWVSVAKYRMGVDGMDRLLDMYIASGHCTPGLKGMVAHVAGMMMDRMTLDGMISDVAQESIDLMHQLHGILTSGRTAVYIPEMTIGAGEQAPAMEEEKASEGVKEE